MNFRFHFLLYDNTFYVIFYNVINHSKKEGLNLKELDIYYLYLI